MNTSQSVSSLYAMIGPAGAALIVLGLMAALLIVRNWIYLFLTARDFKKAAAAMALSPGSAESLLRRYANNPVVGIIADVFKTHGRHSDDLKAEVAYLFHVHFSRTQRDLSILRVIALISPMLGLLGTLLGLSGVFKTLAASASLNTSAILAAGIWEAILTTIMGLTLAIPALIAGYLFRLRLRGFHLTAIEYGYRFLDYKTASQNNGRPAGPARQADGRTKPDQTAKNEPGGDFSVKIQAAPGTTRAEAGAAGGNGSGRAAGA
ncbi:MAG: MotA/TolQ/ExbB proton channel family protein [Deltaproteobacteria bacterium]|jgi:biopolymer transport protein ExbB|nr:MotA/TolQ/ExbB proton channel family protein [Deltaproteobacteria bacterium]